MPNNTPNLLTLLRMALIPVMILIYYLPVPGKFTIVTVIFVLAGITDWLDGYLARRWGQTSAFGAFLDPVADKLIVAVALVLLVSDPWVQENAWSRIIFAITTAIIIGREIVISALREWMAEIGKRGNVAVSMIGKVKTTLQIVAISMLLYREPLMDINIFKLGEGLFYVAGILTLWSMIVYLRAAWPSLNSSESET